MKRKVAWGSIVTIIILATIAINVNLNNKNKTITVKEAEVVQGDIKAYLSTSGTIDSQNNKSYFGTQGKVKEVKVKVGDTVKIGDVLATYEVQDLNFAVNQARIQYDNAVLALNELNSQKASNDKKISDLDKQIVTLSKSSNVTDAINLQLAKQSRASVMPISKEKITQAENSVSLAKITLDNAQNNLSKVKESIVSDIEGVITKVNIAQNAMDSGAQPAIIVQDLNNLKVLTKISKYDANKIALGQDVNIKANNKVCKGSVSFINPIASKDASISGTDVNLNVEIKILEGSDQLKIGFDADIDILINSISGVMKVPAESIKSERDGVTFVYIIEEKKAVRKDVVLGIQSDTEVEIKSGLALGDKVILNPTDLISDGTEVKE